MEELLNDWNEKLREVDECYGKLQKAQQEYDILSAKYYQRWCPKNWIADKIVQEHPDVYNLIVDLKIQLHTAESALRKSEKVYSFAQKSLEIWNKIDININTLDKFK